MPRQNLNAVGRTAKRARVIGVGTASWSRVQRTPEGLQVQPLFATDRGTFGKIAEVVTMPKAWREEHPDAAFKIIDWRADRAGDDDTATFRATRAQAKAYAESLIRL